jgi:alpha-mannosidase
VRYLPEQQDWDVEFVARDVPAFGWKRVRLAPSDDGPADEVDVGREIAAGGTRVHAGDDGTLDVTIGGRSYHGMCALEDVGDRGDTYDFDPVPGAAMSGDVEVARMRHASGIEELRVKRYLAVPMLDASRAARSEVNRYLEVTTHARIAPGVDRIDLRVVVHNEAPDHRLRMLFPTGERVETFAAATTFGVAQRSTAPCDDASWIHPAPRTFPSQGWIAAGDLCVVAPGLYEAEVTPHGVIAVTLLRAVGWLSRMDLTTRPQHAGPGLETPGAQCLRTFEARISLLAGGDPRAAGDAEAGLLAVAAGEAPLTADGAPLLSLEPRELVLTALKPAEHGNGFVLRVLNPTDEPREAVVSIGLPVAEVSPVRLDETTTNERVSLDGSNVRFEIPRHALRSVLITRRV